MLSEEERRFHVVVSPTAKAAVPAGPGFIRGVLVHPPHVLRGGAVPEFGGRGRHYDGLAHSPTLQRHVGNGVPLAVGAGDPQFGVRRLPIETLAKRTRSVSFNKASFINVSRNGSQQRGPSAPKEE